MSDQRGENILDSGAHYYEVYETSDGKYVAVGSIEAKFYRELMRLSGLAGEKLPASERPRLVARDEAAAGRDFPHQNPR